MQEGGEALQHTDAVPQISSERLDNHRAAKIMFTSFRLSQGDGPFQKKLFNYLHSAHPSWRIEDPDQITELTTKRIMDMFNPGGPDKKGHYFRRLMDNFHRGESNRKDYYPRKTASGVHERIKTERIVPQTKAQVDSLREVLNSPPGSSGTPEQLASSIVNGFLVRDAHFFNKGGRERANSDSGKIVTDPFSSFTIEYIMRGKSTGVAEFDEMCRTLREHILQQVAHPTTEWENSGSLLNSIISTYNDNHSSEQQYTLPISEDTTKGTHDVANESFDS